MKNSLFPVHIILYIISQRKPGGQYILTVAFRGKAAIMKKAACLISLVLAVVLVFPVFVHADVIWEPPMPEETETEAVETVAEKEETETEQQTDKKREDSYGSSEARDLSKPIIAVSASVLVIAAALLAHNIVRSKKEGHKE